MNPKDLYHDSFYDARCQYEEEMEVYENAKYHLDKRLEEEIKAKQAATDARIQKAREAYASLRDVAGVASLEGTVSTDGANLVIPVESIELLVARLAALQSNVLAEGVL